MSREKLSRDEILRRARQRGRPEPEPDDEPEKPVCPWHYRKTVMAAAESRLRSKNVTRGAHVAAAKNSAMVRVILETPGPSWPEKGYANTADCQGAFESDINPEQVGYELVDGLLEQVEAARIK